MSVHETAHVFTCAGQSLIGILATPVGVTLDTGVLIVVGGPQYRIGSHRQFTLLARAIAASGHPTLRFDCRGMGDSTGNFPGFHDLDADIAAAIDVLMDENPRLQKVVLWGLCDGASAALLYAKRRSDPRIAGAILANPWLHSEQAKAHAIVHTYYRRHFFEGAFWRKLLRGEVNPLRSWRDFQHHRQQAKLAAEAGEITQVMLEALSCFSLPMLILLSTRDATAQAFLSQLQLVRSPLLSQAHVRRVDFAEADHTFSRAEWRKGAESVTISWLHDMFGTSPSAPLEEADR